MPKNFSSYWQADLNSPSQVNTVVLISAVENQGVKFWMGTNKRLQIQLLSGGTSYTCVELVDRGGIYSCDTTVVADSLKII